MARGKPALLRLLAQDPDDLVVISAALQDAVTRVGDISFEPKGRRLTILFNRFRWEVGKGQRVRAGLQIGSVLGVQARKIQRGAKDAVLELLAVTLEPDDPPGGSIVFSFAGGGDLRVSVECVEAVLADLSPPWPTPRTPAHEP